MDDVESRVQRVTGQPLQPGQLMHLLVTSPPPASLVLFNSKKEDAADFTWGTSLMWLKSRFSSSNLDTKEAGDDVVRDHLVGVGYLLRWTYLVRQQRALGSDWRQFPSTMRILSSTRAWMFSARLSRRLQARCRNTYRGKQLTLGGWS